MGGDEHHSPDKNPVPMGIPLYRPLVLSIIYAVIPCAEVGRRLVSSSLKSSVALTVAALAAIEGEMT